MDILERLNQQQSLTRNWALGKEYKFNANDKALIAEVKRWHEPKERKATMNQLMYKIIGRLGGLMNKRKN